MTVTIVLLTRPEVLSPPSALVVLFDPTRGLEDVDSGWRVGFKLIWYWQRTGRDMLHSIATIAGVGGFLVCIAAALVLALRSKSKTPDT